MRIAQITDAHILEKGTHWFSEPLTATDKRLSLAISFLNELQPKVDVVLFTGDLTEDGKEGSYRHLRELLQPLQIPLYVIPGNHDRRDALRSAFRQASYLPQTGFLHYALEFEKVRLLGLDTVIEGEGGGALCTERLDWLEHTLDQNTSLSTFLFMHHPPAFMRTGTKLFDRSVSAPSMRFEQLLFKHSQILGIFAGHYHSLCAAHFGGKMCWIAPSLAPPQYVANNREDEEITALELLPPAVTIHEWFGGDQWASHVHFAQESPFRLEWTSLWQRHVQHLNLLYNRSIKNEK